MSESSPSEPSRSVSQRRAELEERKLRLEVEQLQGGIPRRLHDVIPIITTVVAVVGFAWGIFQYVSQSERELMRPWLEDQRDTYVEALRAAEILASSDGGDRREKALENFDSLYNGRMILVETKDVCQAMIDFREAVNARADKATLQAHCRYLASTMGESMAASSTMSYAAFNNAKYSYSRGVKRENAPTIKAFKSGEAGGKEGDSGSKEGGKGAM